MKITVKTDTEEFDGEGIWKEEDGTTVVDMKHNEFSFCLRIRDGEVWLDTKDAAELKAQFGHIKKAEISTPFGTIDADAGLLSLKEEPDAIHLSYWVMEPQSVIHLSILKEPA